jgi:rhodanese-related sulfurtransferase
MENNFTLSSKMQDVERQFPFARSTLHSQFHIGGCTKCGYEPDNTIEEVAKKYAKDPLTILESLNHGLEDMQSSEISMTKFAELMHSERLSVREVQGATCTKSDENSGEILIIDVREEWEYNVAHIPGSILLVDTNFKEVLAKAKQASHVVVVCHHGMRSMNATLYLREQGIYNAKSLRGGIDAYSLQIDQSIQRY